MEGLHFLNLIFSFKKLVLTDQIFKIINMKVQISMIYVFLIFVFCLMTVCSFPLSKQKTWAGRYLETTGIRMKHLWAVCSLKTNYLRSKQPEALNQPFHTIFLFVIRNRWFSSTWALLWTWRTLNFHLISVYILRAFLLDLVLLLNLYGGGSTLGSYDDLLVELSCTKDIGWTAYPALTH